MGSMSSVENHCKTRFRRLQPGDDVDDKTAQPCNILVMEVGGCDPERRRSGRRSPQPHTTRTQFNP
jgi:hypothetical protein